MNDARPLDIIGKILAFALLVFIAYLLWLFVSNLLEADANIKTSVIGFISAIAIASFTHYQTKKREISARHFADKREGYLEIINLIFDILKSVKEENEDMFQEDMTKKMMSFKKSLMVWGGPEVIKAWNTYEVKLAANELKSTEEQSPKEMIQDLDNILRAFRKDLGHNDGTLPSGSLAALILVAEDKNVALGGH